MGDFYPLMLIDAERRVEGGGKYMTNVVYAENTGDDFLEGGVRAFTFNRSKFYIRV